VSCSGRLVGTAAAVSRESTEVDNSNQGVIDREIRER